MLEIDSVGALNYSRLWQESTVGTLNDNRLSQKTLLGCVGAIVYIVTHCWNNEREVVMSRNERSVPGYSSDFETVAWG
jgi:hypothetical protein